MSEAFNEDFEVDILTQSACDPAYRKRVKRTLDAVAVDVWSTDVHGEMWEILRRLGDADTLTDPIIDARLDQLERRGKRALADELDHLAGRVMSTTAKAPSYAVEELQEWVRHHEIRSGLEDAIKLLGDEDHDAIDERLRELSRRTSRTLRQQWEGGEWFRGFEERQERRIAERDDPTLAPFVETRIPSLDRVLGGGLRETKVGLVVGHTGRGKSAIVLGFTFNAGAQGTLSVYISTEMNVDLVNTRLDARCFAYPVGDLTAAKFSSADEREFEARRARLRARLEDNIFVFSVPPKTLNLAMIHEILGEVESKTGRKVGFLAVDSPDHMVPMTKFRDYRLEQAANYWDLKHVAEERHIATWASTQGAKEYMGRLITAEGTSESYDKARIADVIFTLNQSPEEEGMSVMRGFVAKNRSGEKGAVIYLATDFARMHVEETAAPVATASPSARATVPPPAVRRGT